MHRSIFVAALGVAALSAPAVAQAQVTVTPGQIEARVVPGERLPAVTFVNSSDQTLDVRVSAVPTEQDLSGLPAYRTDAASQAAGRRLLRLSASRLRVAPRRSARVRVDVVGRPGGAPAAYAVVLFTARPARAVTGRGARVVPQLQLSSRVLLRYPGPARRSGSITGMRALATGDGHVGIGVVTRNTGDIHARAAGTLELRGPSGGPKRLAVQPALVLPRASRELTVVLPAGRPAGDYEASVRLRIGRSTVTRRVAFTLSATDVLAAGRADLQGLGAERDGQTVAVTGQLVNVGTAPLDATVVLTAREDGRKGSTRRIPVAGLAPDGRLDLSTALADEQARVTGVDVAVVAGGSTLIERSIAVTVPPANMSAWDRLSDWAAAHVRLLVGGLAAVVLALLAALGLLIRRMSRAARAA